MGNNVRDSVRSIFSATFGGGVGEVYQITAWTRSQTGSVSGRSDVIRIRDESEYSDIWNTQHQNNFTSTLTASTIGGWVYTSVVSELSGEGAAGPPERVALFFGGEGQEMWPKMWPIHAQSGPICGPLGFIRH